MVLNFYQPPFVFSLDGLSYEGFSIAVFSFVFLSSGLNFDATGDFFDCYLTILNVGSCFSVDFLAYCYCDGERLEAVDFFLSSIANLWLRSPIGEILDDYCILTFAFLFLGERSGDGGLRLATLGGLILIREGDFLFWVSNLLLLVSLPGRSATLGQYIYASLSAPKLLRYFLF